jgi:hypothetical protein
MNVNHRAGETPKKLVEGFTEGLPWLKATDSVIHPG